MREGGWGGWEEAGGGVVRGEEEEVGSLALATA